MTIINWKFVDKNKHGKEIFECFNRAVISISSLLDSAIIKCAKDYNKLLINFYIKL